MMELFTFLKEEQNYYWQRPISVFKSFNRKEDAYGIMEEEPFLVDEIELNHRMKKTEEVKLISETMNMYILFSYGTMYSFISPSLMCILLFYHLVMLKHQRRVVLFYT